MLLARPLQAQIDPSAHWRTLRTQHFAVHYTPQLEELARRSAVNAERAYALLARELVPPRGTVDLVISDEVDFSNGSATPVPSNRIVVYASPPVAESALRFTDDWSAMVIQHELTHIFHLDRSRGIWSLAQHVFGRAPFLFPNEYSPSWLTEGLAVYYESRFTGAGRINGSEHRALARAAALDHALPPLGSVSLATSRFPFGESSYAYGSLFVDWLARTRGSERVGRFVEVSSAQLIPLWLNRAARRGFGVSFSSAWREWSDSVKRSLDDAAPAPLPGWRDLALTLADAQPRWVSDSALVYSGTSGRETFAAYRLELDGTRTRLGRRDGQSPNVRLPDGSLLFAQIDFTGPYSERSDLWIERPDGTQRRLTRGARLALPDARGDGAIVAMQVTAGGTRLVRVSRDGRVAPLTSGGPDEQWTEPRWSARGDRIAASRWRRGGISEIVVVDTAGRTERVIASGHSVQAAPAWLDGDRAIAFTSDRTGTNELWVHVLERGTLGLDPGDHRVSRATTALFDPDVSADGRVAATRLRGDGFHVGVATVRCCDAAPLATDSARLTTTAAVPAPEAFGGASRPFSPWRTLAPRYWLPIVGTGMGNDVLLGALTSGADAVGRHAFAASVATVPALAYAVGGVAYRYAGLGLPILDVGASQDWDVRGVIVSGADSVGVLERRTRDASVGATWLRPRVRTALSVTVGAGVEQRRYVTSPSSVTLADSAGRFATATVPRVFAAAAWSNVQRPALSISPEDGISLGATVRERLRSGFGARDGVSTSVVGVVRAYRSLPFVPGYAHHVLALRAAGGWADTRANEYFEPGGTSGSVIELLPGYTVGEGGRTFGVRGFPAASLVGIRAVGASAEYRLPLVAPARGIALLPLFFDRTSLSLFGDAATAWCPSSAAGRQVCTAPELVQRGTIASVGAEAAVQAALLSWDAPYRLRFGVAHPVRGRELAGVGEWTLYGAAGFSF